MHVESSPRRIASIRGRLPLCALALAAFVAGCTDHKNLATSQATHPVGTVLDHPTPFGGSRRFVVDQNLRGQGSQLRIVGVAWGRLVTVRDQLGALQHKDMLIGEDIVTDGVDYQVDTNAITLETTVTILHPCTPSLIIAGVETSSYHRAFQRLDRNLAVVDDKSLDPGELPPFSLVPRNAALVLRFNDLLDETLVSASTVRLLAGYPPTAPVDGRVFADPNHGDALDTNGDDIPDVFHPSRVIIDAAVSPLESVTANPPVNSNVLGLPPSVTSNQPNIVVRIPTHEDDASGQISVLRNLSGHALAFSGNGSRDDDSTTNDIVRAARAGGRTSITGDLNNGFLADAQAPRIVGSQAVVIGTPMGGPIDFTSTVTFLTPACAMPTKVGDVLQQPGVVAEVTAISTPTGSQIPSVSYRVVAPAGAVIVAGQGTLSTLWDPVVNAGRAPCFVRFPSISSPPATGVATDSAIVLRFSEPMDPESVSPFDSFMVSSGDPTLPELANDVTSLRSRQILVSKITPNADVQEFRYQPVVPLAHATGTGETYWLTVGTGAAGATDLAGNRITTAFPVVTFTLDPTQGPQRNGHVVLRFSSSNEIPDNPIVNPPTAFPEVRGQFQLDFINGQLVPRPVGRFSATADRTQTIPATMTFAPSAELTPISRFGSKLMTVWRYCDVGFLIEDESRMNVDVERMAWVPRGGNVVSEVIPFFRISLAHSTRLPDEGINPIPPPGTTFPTSGLFPTYETNLLSATNDPLQEVHPRERGYVLSSADRYTSSTGTVMMPFPLNRGIPQNQYRYYTWRDTSIVEVGGVDSAGAETAIANNVLVEAQAIGSPFAAGQVPTIGLPLLMEFRCYPDDSVLGSNQFDVSQANFASSPVFRAFSTGGVTSSGAEVRKNPDLETVATGGFNPTTAALVPGIDNTFYLGELNLVTRIARAHTIWFSTSPFVTTNTARYATPVTEPSADRLPTGTSVAVAFRGAVNVTPASNLAVNAGPTTAGPLNMNYYGNRPDGTGVTFLGNDTHWHSNPAEINTANFFQLRFTFVGNAETNLMPTLSAVGIAFFQ